LRVSRVRLCQISAAGSGDAPNITLVSENVFESADVILVPMIPTTLSMMTYRKLVQFFDEAGIEGDLLSPPMGSYRFRKWGGICDVNVFAMAVTRMIESWPEATMRRRWRMDYRQAARKCKHAKLGALILKLPTRVKPANKDK
jgi:hypothetical protein